MCTVCCRAYQVLDHNAPGFAPEWCPCGVRLMPGGGIAANVDVQLEPITIEVEAQIVIDMPEVALEMGVLFAVGIPLANSGLGLYGFIGRFVVNGARTLTSTSPDPIQKEIDWYHATLDQKYGKQQGAWGLGLGAVIVLWAWNHFAT